ARGLRHEVNHTPDERTPIGYAHASVTAPSGVTKAEHRALRTDLAIAMTLEDGSVSLVPPEGA
ncbi:MAG: hypothetical protein M3481_12095, partial [Actinomycetota bacterium]|nr:hypothetical protein [Actinomycetota bacterium]